jgi:hypothetical protein
VSKSVFKRNPDGSVGRRKILEGIFCSRPLEMLESPAYRVLSKAAYRVMARLEIELRHHAGRNNGRLIVTFAQFEEYGIERHAIAPAIRELVALGIIRITEQGRGGNADFAKANRFLLTFAVVIETAAPASNDWKRIKTIEEAKALANTARGAKNPNAVTDGKYRWNRRSTSPKRSRSKLVKGKFLYRPSEVD